MGQVIAGACLGAEAVIDTVLPITYLHLRLKPGARLEQPIEHDLNAMLYVFGGDLHVGQRRVEDGQLALLTLARPCTLRPVMPVRSCWCWRAQTSTSPLPGTGPS